MASLGPLNTFPGLVLAYSGKIISFGNWDYIGFLQSVSRSLEVTAIIEGASRWQVFSKILAPCYLNRAAKPGFMARFGRWR